MKPQPEYRVWCHSKMYYPAEGYGLKLTYSKVAGWRLWNTFTNFEDSKEPELIGGRYDDEEFEVLQYTRIRDKNKQKIYEGDLLLDGEKRGYIVGFDTGRFVMQRAVETKSFFGNANVEVVGNTFENPEIATKMNL